MNFTVKHLEIFNVKITWCYDDETTLPINVSDMTFSTHYFSSADILQPYIALLWNK